MTREERMAFLQQQSAARIKNLEEELESLEAFEGLRLLEIGCGHGHWLASYAETHPEVLSVGIDLKSKRIAKGLEKAAKRNLQNLYFWKAEAREFLKATPQRRKWDLICLLFLDPWPKEKHHKKRLIQPAFLDLLADKSAPDARLFFRTDHKPFFDWTREQLEHHPDWEIQKDVPWIHEHGSYFQNFMDSWNSLVGIRNS